MLVVRAIFDVLSRQTANDVSVDDVKTIRRTYFQFLHALVTNNVAQVILCQGSETRLSLNLYHAKKKPLFVFLPIFVCLFMHNMCFRLFFLLELKFDDKGVFV